MVVFTCSACGESVKKGQVEKHVNICRNCQCLSCMDCGKDFWGDDYKSHVKCISEDQKYGGKGYEAKANKGDVKQQEWIQKIHEVIKKPNISPKVRNILEQMHTYDNIPRKKVKFQNWMLNSFNVDNSALQDQVWDIFSEATSNEPSKKLEKPLQKVGSQPVKSEVNPLSTENEMTADKLEKRKSKRERKEERQKNKKTEKKDMKLESQGENFENQKRKKYKKEKEGTEDENEETSKSNNAERKKKKKHERNNTAQVEINGNGNHNKEQTTNTKKQKRKHAEEEPCTTTKRMKYIKTSATTETEKSEDAAMETEEIEDADKDIFKCKFNWKGTIKAVLKQAPNNEISVKKLRKKVLAQYHAVADEHHKSQEDLLVVFNKKVNNNPKFRVLKDKVKLIK
ncbi:cell growth-regulating nucleolar protein isoform 2-T2 [Pangshura tecta]